MDKTAETALRDAFQKPGRRLKKSFFARSVHEVAPDLIGATSLVSGVGGIIVEVEAYDQTDSAAHSFRGPAPRNMVMPRLHLCLPFVRIELVRELRVPSGGLCRRRSHPRDRADPRPGCDAPAAGSPKRPRCAPARENCARRLRSRKRSANCRSTGRRSRSMHAAAKPKSSPESGSA